MKIIGTEVLREGLTTPHKQFKAILNDSGILFFPASMQHSSMKVEGLSYEDDYRGNALAAIISVKSVDIRWHRDFSEERVKAIWNKVLTFSGEMGLASVRVTYQGKPLT